MSPVLPEERVRASPRHRRTGVDPVSVKRQPSHPVLPPVEAESDDRPSGNGVRLRWGTWELAARGASAVYAVCLMACVGGIVYVAPPLMTSVRETTQALHESAVTIRQVAEDVRAARAGVDRVEATTSRVESKLADIEQHVGELRRELRTCVPRRP